MRVRIGRHFEFEASHRLPPDECYGKCSNLHGHRYELTVEIEGIPSSKGWICDFEEVTVLVNRTIIEKYDHSDLNSYFDIPTVEMIAQEIFSQLKAALLKRPYSLKRICLYETRNSYAEVIE